MKGRFQSEAALLLFIKESEILSVKLITIDGPTIKTGIAYFCNGRYKTHHLLDYSKDKTIENRFESMAKGIWSILDTYRPNIIYIEET